MALIIDDIAIVAAEVAEVAVETTETATETASSGVEITAKSSANGSIDILETSGAKTETGIGMPPETNLPKDNIFVDDLPTNVESTADAMPKAELFVDEYPIESDVPTENISTFQESMEIRSEVEQNKQEQPERDPNRFSEKNQYATSEQIQEYRNNPENEPLKEGYKKSGERLRENMEKVIGEDAAEINTSNSEAHHIVGDNQYSGESVTILEKYGIDINAPENGIFLPKDETSDLHGTIHNGSHTSAYNDEVTQRLKVATCKEDVLEILDSIKEDLYYGEIELNNNHKYNI